MVPSFETKAISIYIETGFDLAYDDSLRESGYMEAIGRLRELMDANYPKVIAARERGVD